MTATGRYSYALYLAHVPVAAVAYRVVVGNAALPNESDYGWKFATFAAVAFIVSWFASFASWHIMEKRLLRLKKYFEYSKPAPPR